MPGAIALVIDDGSRDNTAIQARSAGATVITLPLNLGIGGAVQTGFKFALKNGYHMAIQIDGDGQHDPGESKRLFAKMNESGADIVIGSRWLGRGDYEAPTNRRVGRKFLQGIVNIKSRRKFTDTSSGFGTAEGLVSGFC